MAVFTVPPTLQSFGDVVAQKFERPESRALPTFDSAEAGKTAPKTAFRSLELAVPTLSSHWSRENRTFEPPVTRRAASGASACTPGASTSAPLECEPHTQGDEDRTRRSKHPSEHAGSRAQPS